MSADPRRTLGRLGEDLALRHYERLGYALVARNHRTRHGELDLIVCDGRTLGLFTSYRNLNAVYERLNGREHRVLRQGGAFLVYQFTPRARDFMARHFTRIDSGMELINVPPCFLYWGWKD